MDHRLDENRFPEAGRSEVIAMRGSERVMSEDGQTVKPDLRFTGYPGVDEACGSEFMPRTTGRLPWRLRRAVVFLPLTTDRLRAEIRLEPSGSTAPATPGVRGAFDRA